MFSRFSCRRLGDMGGSTDLGVQFHAAFFRARSSWWTSRSEWCSCCALCNCRQFSGCLLVNVSLFRWKFIWRRCERFHIWGSGSKILQLGRSDLLKFHCFTVGPIFFLTFWKKLLYSCVFFDKMKVFSYKTRKTDAQEKNKRSKTNKWISALLSIRVGIAHYPRLWFQGYWRKFKRKSTTSQNYWHLIHWESHMNSWKTINHKKDRRKTWPTDNIMRHSHKLRRNIGVVYDEGKLGVAGFCDWFYTFSPPISADSLRVACVHYSSIQEIWVWIRRVNLEGRRVPSPFFLIIARTQNIAIAVHT